MSKSTPSTTLRDKDKICRSARDEQNYHSTPSVLAKPTKMEKMICPRCQQDYLVNAVIISLDARIRICPECEAFWWTGEDVSLQNFKDYGDYIESQGYSWNSKTLEVVQEAD